MSVSKARRKELKSIYSYSLYNMDCNPMEYDDWINSCYITVNCLQDGYDSLVYQANKEALEIEFPEDQEGDPRRKARKRILIVQVPFLLNHLD
jgi:hypothetical protein